MGEEEANARQIVEWLAENGGTAMEAALIAKLGSDRVAFEAAMEFARNQNWAERRDRLFGITNAGKLAIGQAP
jgi:hypothetical protein